MAFSCLLLFATTLTAQAATENFINQPELESTSTYDDSYYQHDSDNFTIEIGDKNLNNNSKVIFSAPSVKAEQSLVDSIIQFFGAEKQYDIEFDLVQKADDSQIDQVSKDIFNDINESNISQTETRDSKVKIKEQFVDE